MKHLQFKQFFIAMALIVLAWAIYGYTIDYDQGNGWDDAVFAIAFALVFVVLIIKVIVDKVKWNRRYLVFDESTEEYYGKIQLHDKSWRQNCWTHDVHNAYKFTKKDAKDLSMIFSAKIVKS